MASMQWLKGVEKDKRQHFWELWVDFPEIDATVKVGRIDKIDSPDGAMYDAKVGYTDRPYRPYDNIADAKVGLLNYLADLIQEKA